MTRSNLHLSRLSVATTLRIDQEMRKVRTRKNNYELMTVSQATYSSSLDYHGSSGEKRLDSVCCFLFFLPAFAKKVAFAEGSIC